MALTKTLVLLMTAWLASGQRPFFAGTRPIGYPELLNKTTTHSGLEDKFGEGTTQRLPIEANGDQELVDRLSKLPIDKQPFWFINWQAYEANRDKPQTYPQRPNPFLEQNQNTAVNNSGLVNPTPAVVATTDSNPVIKATTTSSGVNNKTDSSVLSNRFGIDVTTVGPSSTSTNTLTNDGTNIQSVNSAPTDATNSSVSTNPKTPELVDVPYADGNKHVDTPKLDANIETKIPEVKVETSKDGNKKVDSVDSGVKETIEEKSEQADVASIPLAIDAVPASKPEVKTDDDIDYTEYQPKSRKMKYEEDDYEDIEVRNTIKLFPGIIQKYQR